MKRKRLTAAEFEARLASDPEYLAMHAAQEAHFRKLEEEYRVAEAPLLQDLRAQGVDVDSVWALVNRGAPTYTHVVPTLARHLRMPYPPAIKDGIARALGVPEAQPYWSEMLEAFKQEADSRVRQGLACALSLVARGPNLDDLLAVVVDPSQGESRAFFLEPLMRNKKLTDGDLLKRLRDDPDLRQEVARLEKPIRGRRR